MKSLNIQNRTTYFAVTALWTVLTVISINRGSTQATERYNISDSQLMLIQIAVSLPLLFIWLAVTYAFLNFHKYSLNLKGSGDYKGFKYIAYGLGVTLIGLILSSILSNVQAAIVEVDESTLTRDNLIIVRNYLSAAVAVLTYWFLLRGSIYLQGALKSKSHWKNSAKTLLLPMAVIAAGYLYLIFSNPNRTTPVNDSVAPTYALNDLAILLTIALPYLVAWFFGLLTILNIRRYRKDAPGIIYKLLFGKFAVGISLVIALSIILQLISQFAEYWAQLGIGGILLIISVIYFVLIYAYLAVAQGARQLNKIEEVAKGA